jgi:hypothetical protein
MLLKRKSARDAIILLYYIASPHALKEAESARFATEFTADLIDDEHRQLLENRLEVANGF